MNKEKSKINVTSEIGNLKKILLHRPGKEIENLTPDLLERLLFDDIPFLKRARKEHDVFADVLRDNGVEVYYLEELAAEAIKESSVRENFIDQFLDEANVISEREREALKGYFSEMNEKELIDKLMAGVRKNELGNYKRDSLYDLVNQSYPFVLDPLPNLYFTRDPFATIGSGITLNHMKTETRNRETIFAEYIFDNHPEFKDADIPKFFDRYDNTSIEGGDELVLSDEVLAFGISHRTDSASIEKAARKIFAEDQPFETILAIQIPPKRAFMHLDTVLTMVDRDKFTIHAEIEGPLKVFSLTKNGDGSIKIAKEKHTLEDILKKYLGLNDVTLIRCAGGDEIAGGREQWNDGSNTLAISPGEVVVYERNYVSNRILKEHGIKTHIISGSELVRGRGGPRCMSMPLYREDLK
ncbi:MAG: arginine deiminase [Bacillota bacterium]